MSTSAEFLSGRSAKATAQRAADLIGVLLHGNATVAGVRAVLLAHGEREPLDLGEADVAELAAAARAVRAVFAAGDTDRAALLLNELLAEWAHPPRLTSHGGAFDWHLHVDGHDSNHAVPWAEWLLTSSCLALAVLLAEWQRPPGGVCASAACGRPFVATGGGEPRRYCSARCATRERVAAHRRGGRQPD